MVEPINNQTNLPGREPQRRGTAMRAYTRQEAATHSPSAAPRDEVSIMGIPQRDLTPPVQAALQQLMAEVHELRQQNDGLKNRVRELEGLADTDPLLPVFNRRAFMRELKRILAFATRHNMPASLVYIDMNRFKAINDEHGHAVGDAALKHVVNVIKDHIRETDILGRLGGDEFGVLLPAADAKGAEDKAKHLEAIIAAHPLRLTGGRHLPLSITYGLRTFTDAPDAEAILAEADARMLTRKSYQAQRDR